MDRVENVDVEMMKTEGKFGINFNIPSLEAEIVEVPYEGDEMSLILMKPSNIDGMSDLEKSLTADIIQDNFFNVVPEDRDDLKLKMPKFSFQQEMNMAKTLMTMGITDVFTPGAADMSGMTEAKNLVVDEVVQKNFFEVNEEGTEAASATGSTIVAISAIPEVTFNRPFIYLLLHKPSKEVLMMGKFSQPPNPDQVSVVGTFRLASVDPDEGGDDTGKGIIPALSLLLTFIVIFVWV